MGISSRVHLRKLQLIMKPYKARYDRRKDHVEEDEDSDDMLSEYAPSELSAILAAEDAMNADDDDSTEDMDVRIFLLLLLFLCYCCWEKIGCMIIGSDLLVSLTISSCPLFHSSHSALWPTPLVP